MIVRVAPISGRRVRPGTDLRLGFAADGEGPVLGEVHVDDREGGDDGVGVVPSLSEVDVHLTKHGTLTVRRKAEA